MTSIRQHDNDISSLLSAPVVLHLFADGLAEKDKIRFHLNDANIHRPSTQQKERRLSAPLAGTYDAIPPAFRIATRTVRYDEIIVRNTFVERDLDKR